MSLVAGDKVGPFWNQENGQAITYTTVRAG